MDDFYKQIRESLNNLPEPSFRKKDWNALSDEMRSRKLTPLAFWSWLTVPLLLMLGTVAYWQYEKNDYNQALHFLKETDTVYITKTVTLTDTVFLDGTKTPGFEVPQIPRHESRQILQMQAEIAALKQQLATTSQQPIELNKAPLAVASEPDEDSARREQYKDAPMEKDRSRGTVGNPDRLSSLSSEAVLADKPVDHVNSRSYAPLESPLLVSLPSRRHAVAGKVRKPSLLWESLVEEFSEIELNPMQLGAGTGLFYPSFGNGEFQIGKMAGLQALMPLTKHFQLESNLSYQNAMYETEDLTETGGVLPIAPAENERFLKVEAPFKALQWDLGLNYALNSAGKIQPKLGLGYGIIYYYQNELSYEYENTDTGIAWSVEDGGNYNGLQANAWLFKTGADYHLNSEWALGLSGIYRIVSGSDSYLTPSYWSIGLGLRFKF